MPTQHGGISTEDTVCGHGFDEVPALGLAIRAFIEDFAGATSWLQD